MSDNLLDKASILLTPTAYNDGSMLSVKPENGDGDFTFSRGSAATRVNAQGLVENVQIISSELVSNGNFSQEGSELVVNGDFATDSNWIKQNGWSIASGSANCNDSTGYRSISQSSLVNTVGKTYKVTYEVSNYVSGAVRCILGGFALGQVTSSNGIVTETITTSNASSNTFVYLETRGSGFIGSIDNVSVKEVGQDWTLQTGWSIGEDKAISDGSINQSIIQNNVFTIGKSYKINFKISDVIGSLDTRIWMATGGAKIEANANGDYTTYWEADGTDLYITTLSTNTATYSITNISVKEITDDTDLPRIDYTDGCGSWLLEGQSTNLITYSEDFSGWFSTNYTAQSNVSNSPSGNNDASSLTNPNGAGGLIKQNVVVAESTNYTFSFYAKKGTASDVKYSVYDNTNGSDIIPSTSYYSQLNSDTFTRVTVSFATPIGCTSIGAYVLRDSAAAGTVIVWGAQVEALPYATSYIPTNGAIATRLADVATNSGNSTLINSTEGVLYAEIAALANPSSTAFISLSDGSGINKVAFYFALNSIKGEYVVNGGTQSSFTYTPNDITSFNKIAFSYKLNQFKMFANGSQVSVTDTLGSVNPSNTFNEISFDYGNSVLKFEGKVKALAVYKEALTDAELQSLTTI